MESSDTRTWVYSLVSSWLFILGSLLLVDSQRIVFLIMSHGIYQSTVLSVNPVYRWVTLSLILIWMLLAYVRGLGSRVFIPALPLAAFPFLGQVAVGVAALTAFILVAQRRDVSQPLATCLLATVGLFMGFTLLYWLVLYPLGQGAVLEDLAVFESKVYYLFAALGPWLYLSLFTAFILRGAQLLVSPSTGVRTSQGGSSLHVLVVLCLLSSGLVLYTLLPGVNPNGIDAGVDFQDYADELHIVEEDPWTFISIMRGERPFLFLLLYVFQRLLNMNVVQTLTYAPMVLNPLLVSSTYVFTRQVFHDSDLALWASFFTVFGSTFSVGCYSYFLSNILGLSLMLVSLTLIFRALENRDGISLVAAMLFGGLTLFTHPWTFVHYYIPLLAAFVWLVVGELRAGSLTLRARYLVVCVAAVVSFELFKGRFLGLYGGVAAFRAFTSSLTNPTDYVTHLLDGTLIRFGGFLANPVIIMLAFVGMFCMKYRNDRDLYLLLLFMSTAAGFLVGGEVIKSRLIFNAPLYIPAGLGLEKLLEGGVDRRLIVTTLTLTLGVILLRSLANIF